MAREKVVQSRNGGNKPAQLTPIGPGEWSVRLRCGNGPRLRYRVRAASEASAAKTVAMMQAAATLLADRPVDALKVLRAIGDAGELEDARACLAVAEKAAKKKAPEPAAMAPQRLTFGQVAGRWTSGALAREYPDHVRVKDGELDAARLDRLGAINVGGVRLRDVAIVEFTLEHAEAAMRGLDAAAGQRKPEAAATRRAYAQLIHRVLALAVYPLRIIAASPLPKGFMPKVGKPPAFSYLYPAEDRTLLRCPEVPLIRRLLFGVLAREGLRASEALGLAWRDVDLERGVVTLDVNKTDDARAWALGADVTRALAAWHDLTKPEPEERVFSETGVPVELDGLASLFREHLQTAGVARHELFAMTANRRPIRVHDLRGSFVTLALADGKTETWVADRTGHRSSQMINRYRRAARGASELGLGWFAPLDLAVPELAGPTLAAIVEGLRALCSPRPVAPKVGHGVGQRGGSTGIRTLDRRIKKAGSSDTETREGMFSAPASAPDDTKTPLGPPETGGGPRPDDPIEAALGAALVAATQAGQWTVVAQLAAELQARREARSGVVRLDAERARRGQS